jgi:uncharacterized protein
MPGRRSFIKAVAAGALTLTGLPHLMAGRSDSLGTSLPRRRLGRTKEDVTLLALGGFHIGWTTEDLAETTINTALEEGIRFFDTAESYGKGLSEELYGRFLVPRARDEIFLMTKTSARDKTTARTHLEDSLRRLKTDRIDLWQMHALKSPDDVEERINGGVLDVLLEARADGRVRHLGFTGHACPYAQKRIMELAGDAFSAAQMPVNPVDAAHAHSFTHRALPDATRRGIGIVAMKSLADGRFFASKDVLDKRVWTTDEPVVPDFLTIRDCTLFALAQPTSSLVIGAENPSYVRDKAAVARELVSLTPREAQQLTERVRQIADAGIVEYYKRKDLRVPSPDPA